MRLHSEQLYLDDIQSVLSSTVDWSKLRNKTVLIAGATGMIGSFLIDVLMKLDVGCNVVALGRSSERARKRFNCYLGKDNFSFFSVDINQDEIPAIDTVHFIIHAASNTHPVAYSTDPIGTIETNVLGTNNLLRFAVNSNTERFVFLSSVEIYGENRGDIEKFSEDYCGYIDCNTLRAGYPESKRVGESLCQAYLSKHELDFVIPRLSRVYGPTQLKTDSKAISQFINCAINGENIILKSEGNQYFSYTYVADAVSGIIYCLLNGKKGEAYNVSDEKSNILLRDLAGIAAKHAGVKVVFELPSDVERKGFSKATKAIMDNTKIKRLGWHPKYPIGDGMIRTIEIKRNVELC